jgi:hypothetical protein
MGATIGPDLDGLLQELAEVPELVPFCGAIRDLVTTPHTADRIQTVIACLAGIHDGTDGVGAIGLAIQNLASPRQPAIAELPDQQQKDIQQWGEQAAFLLLDSDLRTPAAETSAAISHRPSLNPL